MESTMKLSGLKYRYLKMLARFSSWRIEHIPENGFLLIIAMLIGMFSGIAAFLMKFCIRKVSELCMIDLHPFDHYDVRFLVLPLTGIVLTSLYMRCILKQDISQGVSKIRTALVRRKYYMRPSLTYSSIIGSAITLGFGGSAGAEGPIAYTSAAIGSNIGRIFKITPEKMRMMIAIGAGAGIAAIFKAPIGGAFFTLEVLQMQMTTFSVIALAVACISGALTCFACTDFVPDIEYFTSTNFEPSYTFWTIMLGVFCGLYSVYYTALQNKSHLMFKRMRNPWMKNIIAGITVSFFVFMLPALYGEGYNIITDLVDNRGDYLLHLSPLIGEDTSFSVIMIVIVLILAIKSYLVAAVNSGGGVAGDFAPTLFAGALAGFLFASLVDLIPGVDVPTTHFALVGMAAVMAGTIHAPLMAIFITVEMSSSYGFFFPIVVAATISYIVMKLVTPKSKYRTMGHDDYQAFVKKPVKGLG